MTGLLHYIRTSPLLRGALVALLLVCVGVGVFGEYLVFHLIRSDIRHSIEAKIEAGAPQEELTWIKIAASNPPENFVFIKKEREFRYKGEMYDIVNKKVIGDTIYYQCIHDIRESKLYANLDHQIQNEYSTNPTHEKKQTELLKKIPKFYSLSTNSIFLGFTCYTQLPDETHPIWLDALLTIDAPPPEMIITSILRVFTFY